MDLDKVQQLKDEISNKFLEAVNNPEFIELLTSKGLQEAVKINISLDLTKVRQEPENEVQQGIENEEIQAVKADLKAIPGDRLELTSFCWCIPANLYVHCVPFVCPPPGWP